MALAAPDQVLVVADILGQPRACPAGVAQDIAPHFWVDRRAVQPARHEFQIAFVEKHCNRVEVGRMSLKPQPRRLERNGPATGEGIKHRR